MLGEYATADWLSLLTTTATVVVAVATSLYLWATYAMLKETREANHLARTLTLKLHVDSLTPHVAIVSALNRVIVTSATNRTLIVKSIRDAADDDIVIVNERTEVHESRLTFGGDLTFVLYNASKVAADVHLTGALLGYRFTTSVTITPDEKRSVTLEPELHIDRDATARLLAGGLQTAFDCSAKGPGLSAEDQFSFTVNITATSGEAEAISMAYVENNLMRRRRYPAAMEAE